MNLLDTFALRHTQISKIQGELLDTVPADRNLQAKVELNLTPRKTRAGDNEEQPAFQVSATLSCDGGVEGEDKKVFKLQIVMHAVYHQLHGPAINFETFSKHHTTLNRQIYPLINQHLRNLLQQLGLEQVRLPFDLIETPDKRQVSPQVTESVH